MLESLSLWFGCVLAPLVQLGIVANRPAVECRCVCEISSSTEAWEPFVELLREQLVRVSSPAPAPVCPEHTCPECGWKFEVKLFFCFGVIFFALGFLAGRRSVASASPSSPPVSGERVAEGKGPLSPSRRRALFDGQVA